MTDGAVIGAFLFMLSCLALVFLAAGVVGIARAWAEDRRKEAAYAEEWRRTHRINQQMGRYGYDTHRYHYDEPERPE